MPILRACLKNRFQPAAATCRRRPVTHGTKRRRWSEARGTAFSPADAPWFRSAGRRPGRASRPRYPFFRHALSGWCSTRSSLIKPDQAKSTRKPESGSTPVPGVAGYALAPGVGACVSSRQLGTFERVRGFPRGRAPPFFPLSLPLPRLLFRHAPPLDGFPPAVPARGLGRRPRKRPRR